MSGRRSWDSPLPPRPGTAVFVVAGLFFAVPGLAMTFLRIVPPHDDGTALLAAFIPYGIIGYALALLCFGVALLLARRRTALMLVSAIVSVTGSPTELDHTALRTRQTPGDYQTVYGLQPQHAPRAGGSDAGCPSGVDGRR